MGPALALGFAANEATAHPDGLHLIVGGTAESGAVAATIELMADGSLRQTAESPVGEAGGYISVDRTGRYYLSTHYRSALVATHALGDGAVVGPVVTSTRTPNLEAHCIVTTPDNRFVYVPCVKTNNAIFQYAFDESTGELSALEPFDAKPPAMFGPRHVVYHPDLPLAYFSNEQQLGVSVYTIAKDGQLSALQHATTVPRRAPFDREKRALSASSIVLSPDASRLFVAMRDFTGDDDSVFTFRVEADGRLTLLSRTLVGDVPVRLLMSPLGSHLLISESGESRLSAYSVGDNGALTRAASIDLPAGSRDMIVLAD
jgi:6-phosphogluconolactonase (cycloisomerase 2 family)